jgi:hypothetical protein
MSNGVPSEGAWKLGFAMISAIALIVAIWVGNTTHSRTSAGVEYVNYTLAHIHEDDTLVLMEMNREGGPRSWRITLYDDTVYFTAEGVTFTNSDRRFTLCDLDCTVETELGSPSRITLTRMSDGGVDIEWPAGQQWQFREYQR